MKCVAFSLFLVAATAVQTTEALKKYLDNIPNGASFKQALGHPDDDETKFTAFATAFQAVDLTWTTDFCKAMFPGASMTNGAAFGDPCCTWKKGGTPDSTVTAFTTTPTKATVCASAAAATTPAPATTTATPTATTATPASTTATPATTTAAPSSDSASSAGSSTTTPAPATTTAAPATTTKPSSGKGTTGCIIKKHKGSKGSKGGKGGKGGKKFRGSSSGSAAKAAGSAY